MRQRPCVVSLWDGWWVRLLWVGGLLVGWKKTQIFLPAAAFFRRAGSQGGRGAHHTHTVVQLQGRPVRASPLRPLLWPDPGVERAWAGGRRGGLGPWRLWFWFWCFFKTSRTESLPQLKKPSTPRRTRSAHLIPPPPPPPTHTHRSPKRRRRRTGTRTQLEEAGQRRKPCWQRAPSSTNTDPKRLAGHVC